MNLNYHEFLIDIAYYFERTKNIKYVKYIEKTILDWFVQNPLVPKATVKIIGILMLFL